MATSFRNDARSDEQAIDDIAQLYLPLQRAAQQALEANELLLDPSAYRHVQTTGTIESYQHEDTQRLLHNDRNSGQFYDRAPNQISRADAVEYAAAHTYKHAPERSEGLVRAALDPDEGSDFRRLVEGYNRQKAEVADERQDRLDQANAGQSRYEVLDRALQDYPVPGSQLAQKFLHVQTTGTIQSYLNYETRRHLHIDGANGQFYDQSKNLISKAAAVEHVLANEPRYEPDRPTLDPDLEAKYRPLERRIGLDIVDEFEWKGLTGSIATYQHQISGRDLYLDIASGQFHASSGRPITATKALSEALPSLAEHLHAQEATPERALGL